MPSAVRQVNFSPVPVYCRPPRDDEAFVMQRFARHAKRCSQCAHPFDSFVQHRSLCEKGLIRAKDVAQYVVSRNGKAFSSYDKEGIKPMQIEIPYGCDAVRELLKAIERGMQLYAQKTTQRPIISYDPNYFVAPRPAPKQQYITIKPTSHGHRERIYIPGRGSLYDSDMAERRERRQHRDEDMIYHLDSHRHSGHGSRLYRR